jgi:hypothetical protein
VKLGLPVGVLALAAALTLVSTAAADRAPTAVERAAIMDVFNIPGRTFSPRCVRIRVSTVDARYAILTPPRRIPRVCRQTGQVGDGFVFFRRARTSGQKWKDIYEGSDVPPCKIPVAVRRDFGFGSECF